MIYLILGVIVIIFITVALHNGFSARGKKINQIRKEWGSHKQGPFDFERIGTYAAIVNEPGCRLTDQTMDDIDFQSLFAFVDRTTSKVGQQFLFNTLISPSTKVDPTLNEMITLYSTHVDLRENIQVELSKLDNHDAYYIAPLLREKLFDVPPWSKFLYLSNLVIIALLLLSLKYAVLLIFLIIPLAANMLLHYWNKLNTLQFIRSFPQLNLLVDVASNLNKNSTHQRKTIVESDISNLRVIQRNMAFLGIPTGSIQDELSQIISYFIELLKAFFLVEVMALFHILHQLEKRRSSILILFNFVGTIDTAISIVSLRSGNLKTCQPEFTQDKKELISRNIYHPLIPGCVKNDLIISEKSILITGSNMSGKSTFLRTLLINSILAQTIMTCFADEFKTPILSPLSAIRIDDSLLEAKSYYLEEVHVMASLIKEVTTPGQNLFVLDEVFKGTNSIERIAAAKAVLSYLNQSNHIVIVSTHDLELSEMLKNEYDLYHFTDSIEREKLHFDHKIKEGQLRTRNAIRILEMSNYPATIVAEAKYLSNLGSINAATNKEDR